MFPSIHPHSLSSQNPNKRFLGGQPDSKPWVLSSFPTRLLDYFFIFFFSYLLISRYEQEPGMFEHRMTNSWKHWIECWWCVGRGWDVGYWMCDVFCNVSSHPSRGDARQLAFLSQRDGDRDNKQQTIVLAWFNNLAPSQPFCGGSA